jgi:hypothetical protein
MDLLTVMMHELGHAIGFDDDHPDYAVMSEGLEPGVRYLLDAVGFDADPDQPISDRALLQLAAKAARLEASGGIPDFGPAAGPGAGVHASIDWQAPSGENWGIRYSPYASPAKPGQGPLANFSDFLLKPFRAESAPAADAAYDSLGRDLVGSGAGKGGGAAKRA